MRSDLDVRSAFVTLVGNPASRRVAAFVAAVRRMWGIPVRVVSYLDLLRGRDDDPPAPGGIVRIESPGECAATTKGILKAGIRPLEALGETPLDAADVDELPLQRGELFPARQWYFGFRSLLNHLEADWCSPDVRWMSTPRSIAAAFDKLACLELWSAAGLQIPERYPDIASYDDLRRRIPARLARLFVKLRYGFSAMGAVALEWRDSRLRAITTVEVVRSEGRARLFVTKKPRVLDRELDVAWLIDVLAKEDILVERWLPKARWQGRPFDLRVVTIGQRACHVVGRANDSPFTNLNLDARRISREALIRHLGDTWPEIESLCARAAATLPDAGMLGIDLLVRPCLRKLALLEANAFGDFLPGLSFAGLSTYEMELQQFSTTEGSPA